MSINFNVSPSPYFQTPNFAPVSDSATRGRTKKINAVNLGQEKLFNAFNLAETLEKMAEYQGSAIRVTGQQAGNAAAVGGISDAISNIAYGAFKGGHLGGGSEGAPPSGEAGY